MGAKGQPPGMGTSTVPQVPEYHQPGTNYQPNTDNIMHSTTKLASFMALRANGWSLARIGKELRISKTTLWDWDQKNRNQIHMLKHLQMEKIQEQYLPTYEEELQQIASQLARIEQALGQRDMEQLSTEFLMQMSLQLRAKLGKMREQVPLRPIQLDVPLEPLPFTGCVTRQDADGFIKEFRQDTETLHDEPAPATTQLAADRDSNGAQSPAPANGKTNGHQPLADIQPKGNGRPRRHRHPRPEQSARCHPSPSSNQNRTFPNENPRGVKNGALILNNFQTPKPNGRSVLPDEKITEPNPVS